MIPLYYDLHIHSCLSPCGDDDMTPGNIVGMAAVKGLDVIALTDHNSCRNCPAALEHGKNFGVTVIPGMELCTSEEVHVICLFPTLSDALEFDAYVYAHMLPIKNKEAVFGKQQIMDEQDMETERVENLLIAATDISFDQVTELTASYHGIAYPAHLDKTSTSLLSNLGFIPPDSKFTCAEVHDLKKLHSLQKANPYLSSCNIVSCSDAHYLGDINEPDYQLYSESKSIPHILAALTNPRKSP
ncbi:MAG: PHP domain-containing protein [Eubacteriales bacterium]|nr:PHP domain-containing protein [Eubacteriales bacterium]